MKFIKRLLIFALVCTVLGVTTIFGFYLYVKPDLPDVATLKSVELQTPMQVYSADGALISQFGEKRRIPVMLEDIPQPMIDALIATEDSRFYQHPGIDPIGIVRAAVVVAMSGTAKQGASTITQQLARNFFLSNEKRIMRKIKEIFIAVHIEQLLSKEEILELYFNKVFLGYRSYGVGAAAQVYFGKTLDQLTLSEMAVIVGLPKAPSTMNPLYSLSRATDRRNVVLGRMLKEGYISNAEYQQAKNEPIVARYHGAEIELSAPYVAEMARAWAVEQFGEDAYTSGVRIFTSVDADKQRAANEAAVENVLAYDRRHGFRGPVATLWQAPSQRWQHQRIVDHLAKQPSYGPLEPAVVIDVQAQSAQVIGPNGREIELPWKGLDWARPYITDSRQGPAPKRADEFLASGQQIFIRQVDNSWHLAQVPTTNTALVSMSPSTGAIKALVGGFNFVHSKFNRATQSVRQVGSSIKPFIYSAAVNEGMTLATLINDAPINRWDRSQGVAWRPKNSPPRYEGPLRARLGLAQSKNVMAVRVLRRVGLDDTLDYLTRFGFKRDDLPRAEAIALGAGSLTPVEMAQGFSVFANGGYFMEPFIIDRVETPFGEEIYRANPPVICDNCEQQTEQADPFNEQNLLAQDDTTTQRHAKQVIDEQNAFLVREMMQSNIWGGGDWRYGTGWNGTGWRAQALKRRDIGGKTGTTNDSKDTWYTGYSPGIVTTVWVGFDDHSRKLGRTTRNANLGDERQPIRGAESGAKTAEPAWIDFMQHALADVPEQNKAVPPGIVKVRIDRETGLLTRKTDHTSMFEYFIKGTEPTEYVSSQPDGNIYESGTESLF
ncbi:penicillin-sensitive transpeptidase [Salinivibrio kushneri]|uniref:Penicillin-binding protein 1A n=1 Tax=Salinivibrio kushneri TaxID=1908198 RepID=A0AB36JWN9_9GAMM|nr:PBP1A family penicillin-binding protein [Salinivibrio kushneri]OOE40127.1 penicillin-sensitive transpeptidase [Salinivibrio kushneri]QCP01140.1 PBP1A family penicillin-binding protein [Salinivibrio kushneri]